MKTLPDPVSERRIQRRRFSEAFKRDIVSQCMQPNASVSAIALANGLNTNQVFKWRRMALDGERGSSSTMLPVTVEDISSMPVVPALRHEGAVEIRLERGAIRLTGPVDVAILNALMASLTA
ncbi:IS66-like element accessory protein TnpA [Cupriavidus sp. H18C2]|uniref:IS66-like element accessory protein TnpA n=1 Tax=Cupriavidus sp. H18C2 TaxID=3241602 RepID=UPI003BF815D8